MTSGRNRSSPTRLDRMSEKMTCPGCNSHTSSILRAFEDGEPCPVCGLSAQAAEEITTVRTTRANDQLKEQAAAAIERASRAEQEVKKLTRKLDRVRRALEDDSDDW